MFFSEVVQFQVNSRLYNAKEPVVDFWDAALFNFCTLSDEFLFNFCTLSDEFLFNFCTLSDELAFNLESQHHQQIPDFGVQVKSEATPDDEDDENDEDDEDDNDKHGDEDNDEDD